MISMKTMNPLKITITNPTIASEAGQWCNDRFGEQGWELWTQDIFTGCPKYKFEFFNKQDMILFSLRWSEYA